MRNIIILIIAATSVIASDKNEKSYMQEYYDEFTGTIPEEEI